MAIRKQLLPLALPIFLACTAGSAGAQDEPTAPQDIVFGEAQLFAPAPPAPLGVWADAAMDGSRKAIALKAGDGVALRGWMLASPDPKAPLVLTFRGNGESLNDPYSFARDTFFTTRLNLSLVSFDYRGTGFSEGSVSLAKALADSLAVYDKAVELAAGRSVIVCGWSLGSIFASYVAGNRPSVAALILLGAVASEETYVAAMRSANNLHFITSPSLKLIQDTTQLRKYRNPLLVIHGTDDDVVPMTEGRLDFDAAGSADKSFVALQHKGHSGAIWSIEADDAIAAFMASHFSMGTPPN